MHIRKTHVIKPSLILLSLLPWIPSTAYAATPQTKQRFDLNAVNHVWFAWNAKYEKPYDGDYLEYEVYLDVERTYKTYFANVLGNGHPRVYVADESGELLSYAPNMPSIQPPRSGLYRIRLRSDKPGTGGICDLVIADIGFPKYVALYPDFYVPHRGDVFPGQSLKEQYLWPNWPSSDGQSSGNLKGTYRIEVKKGYWYTFETSESTGDPMLLVLANSYPGTTTKTGPDDLELIGLGIDEAPNGKDARIVMKASKNDVWYLRLRSESGSSGGTCTLSVGMSDAENPGAALLPNLVPIKENPLAHQDYFSKDYFSIDCHGASVSTAVANVGHGPLWIEPLPGSDTMADEKLYNAFQVVLHDDGSHTYHLVGNLISELDDPAHNHWHYVDFATFLFAIWGVGPVSTSAKIGFHPSDMLPFLVPSAPSTFNSVGTKMGISSGWSDVYSKELPGQSVSFPVSAGKWYLFAQGVNPNGWLLEQSYDDNWQVVGVHTGPNCEPDQIVCLVDAGKPCGQ